jgi:hypothetical protein
MEPRAREKVTEKREEREIFREKGKRQEREREVRESRRGGR